MSGVVLVVEDDRELRELVRRYLQRAGHAVHTTGSGAEALGLLAAGGVDLVVLDLGLPDVDGLEVLAATREQPEIPVVVLTAAVAWRTASTACAGAPTTTSPSRSARPSWSCACRRCCTAPAQPQPGPDRDVRRRPAAAGRRPA
jgi:CheY-like chemotaxis protein